LSFGDLTGRKNRLTVPGDPSIKRGKPQVDTQYVLGLSFSHAIILFCQTPPSAMDDHPAMTSTIVVIIISLSLSYRHRHRIVVVIIVLLLFCRIVVVVAVVIMPSYHCCSRINSSLLIEALGLAMHV
jgi:hypothetical protein